MLKVGEQSVVEVEAMGEAMDTVNTVGRYDDCMHFHKTNHHVQSRPMTSFLTSSMFDLMTCTKIVMPGQFHTLAMLLFRFVVLLMQ